MKLKKVDRDSWQNHIEDNTTSDGFYIEDPENFVCKDWC